MAEYLTNDTDLKKVADAIREKGGTTEKLTYPSGFAAAIAKILPASGGDFHPSIVPVKTPSGELIPSNETSGVFITAPPFKNGFIFLNWDITINDDLDFSLGGFVPEIMYVYIPSINVDKGMVTLVDMLDTGNIMAADNWIKYRPGAAGISWTDAFKQTDYAKDYLVWASKSGYSTLILF